MDINKLKTPLDKYKINDCFIIEDTNNKYLNVNLNNIQFTVDTFKSINITIDNLKGLKEEKDIKQSLFDLNIAQINTNKQLGGNVNNTLDEL